MEGRIELAHRDTKAEIYITAVMGIVSVSVSVSLLPHLLDYHKANMFHVIGLIVLGIVGIYLIYKAYQEFKDKYHQLALFLAKKD